LDVLRIVAGKVKNIGVLEEPFAKRPVRAVSNAKLCPSGPVSKTERAATSSSSTREPTVTTPLAAAVTPLG